MMNRQISHSVLWCVLAAALAWPLGVNALDSNPYGLSYPYNTGYLMFPEDEGGHGQLSLLGSIEWWGFNGILGDKNGNRYAFNAKFNDLRFPWVDLDGTVWGFDMPELFSFGLTDMNDNKHYGHVTGPVIDAAYVDTDNMSLRWLDSYVTNTGHFVYETRFDDPENDITLELKLESETYPLPMGWDGHVQFTWDYEIWEYSLPKVHATGKLWIKGKPVDVQGVVWIDHQWYPTNYLEQLDLIGTKDNYEVFTIRLSDNTKIQLWRITFDRNSPPYIPAVNIQFPDGRIVFYDEMSVSQEDEPTVLNAGYWTSADTGNIYSYGWDIELPGENIYITLYPYAPDQEMEAAYLTTDISTWTGHCFVKGISGKGPVTGFATVESTTKYTVPGAPNPPTDFTGQVIDRDEVMLSWARNAEPDVINYRLYWGDESRVYRSSLDVGDGTSWVLQGLPSDKKWYFTISAVNTANEESFYGDEIELYPTNSKGPYVRLGVDLPWFMQGDTIHISTFLENPGNPAYPVDLYTILQSGSNYIFLHGDSGFPLASTDPVFSTFNIPGRQDGKYREYHIPLSVSVNPMDIKLHAALFDTGTSNMLYYTTESFSLY